MKQKSKVREYSEYKKVLVFQWFFLLERLPLMDARAAINGRQWYYRESRAYQIDEEEARRFDEQCAPKKKEFRPSQEEFYIHSHSVIR